MPKYTRAKVDLLVKKENEVWLYSYADLITNLLAFFLLLLVIQQSGASTAQKVQESIAKVMGTGGYTDVPNEKEFLNIVTQFLKVSELKNNIAIEKTVEGVSITFSGGLFFETLSANMTAAARGTLDGLVPMFTKLPEAFRFDIEGHADSRPLAENDIYASNWELSSARAGSVVRYLASKGVPATRLRAIGYGDTKPVSEDLDQNRRVVIRIGKGIK